MPLVVDGQGPRGFASDFQTRPLLAEAPYTNAEIKHLLFLVASQGDLELNQNELRTAPNELVDDSRLKQFGSIVDFCDHCRQEYVEKNPPKMTSLLKRIHNGKKFFVVNLIVDFDSFKFS